LRKNAAHHAVAFGRAISGGDTGTFVAAGAHSDPGSQLGGGSEGLGLRSDLGDDVLRRPDADAGHLAQPFHGVLMLSFGLGQGLLDAGHMFLDLFDLLQEQLQDQLLGRAQMTAQGIGELLWSGA
jgi:hypothetical protein